ncbi:COMM domain-containing protein 2 isoform X1 [Stigmatopora nigra]
MLLVLSEEHKEHLEFLNKVDATVVGEFGRIALEFLRRGIKPKVYDGAARKLSLPAETVQRGVEGLMYLMTQSSKHMLSESDFVDSVLSLDLGEELNQSLLQLTLTAPGRVSRADVPTARQRDPSRLDAAATPLARLLQPPLEIGRPVPLSHLNQLASRSLRQQTAPSLSVVLQLTQGPGSPGAARILQADPATLLHLLSILEGALAALKSTHARRVLRNVK